MVSGRLPLHGLAGKVPYQDKEHSADGPPVKCDIRDPQRLELWIDSPELECTGGAIHPKFYWESHKVAETEISEEEK